MFSAWPFLWRFELLCEPFAGAVVVNAEKKERKVFGPCGAHVSNGIGEARASISEEWREGIVRNHENSDIDHACGQRVSEVTNIHDEQIAAGRHLNLDAEADLGAVDVMTFHPVNIACLRDGPPSGGLEARIDQLANSSATVCVSLFFHT